MIEANKPTLYFEQQSHKLIKKRCEGLIGMSMIDDIYLRLRTGGEGKWTRRNRVDFIVQKQNKYLYRE